MTAATAAGPWTQTFDALPPVDRHLLMQMRNGRVWFGRRAVNVKGSWAWHSCGVRFRQDDVAQWALVNEPERKEVE